MATMRLKHDQRIQYKGRVLVVDVEAAAQRCVMLWAQIETVPKLANRIGVTNRQH